ncbi:MAG: hypothetical protein RIT45_236 [Pseudomonadota bacterium]
MTEPTIFRVSPDDAGQRLDRFLAHASGHSRGAVRRAIEAGAVWVDGDRERVQARALAAGAEVALHEQALTTSAPPPEPRIVHEDDDLLVLDKPAGLPTSPPPEGGASALGWVHDTLGLRGRDRVGEVHRLDRDASGLLVFGKHREAVGALGRALQRRQINRGYLAWIHARQRPAAERIDAPLRPRKGGGVELHPAGSPAATRALPVAFSTDARIALLALSLESGRLHQIRAHLAWAAGPIVGDARYGAPEPEALGRVALHAARLALRHPKTGQGLAFVAPPSDPRLAPLVEATGLPDFVTALRELGRGAFDPDRALAAMQQPADQT